MFFHHKMEKKNESSKNKSFLNSGIKIWIMVVVEDAATDLSWIV